MGTAVGAPRVRRVIHSVLIGARGRLPCGSVVPRVLRTSLPDGYFHVISRGVDGCSIFRDDDDRRKFLALVRTCVETYGWTIHALCLMTTHYHLVLHSTRRDLSRGLQRLNGCYGQGFNERHGRFGHLFADRFTSRSIEAERYLAEACRYVVENPVRAGLCATVEDWPWAHSRTGPEAATLRAGLPGRVPANLDLVHRCRRHAAESLALLTLEPRELEELLHIALLVHDLVRHET